MPTPWRFKLLSLWLVALCLSLAGVSGSTPSPKLDERIRRVENGLIPPFIIKGEPAMKLADRMKFYNTPGVSIAVINHGKVEWARGYGVLEAGGNRPVTSETLFQSASISKPVTAMAALRLVQEGRLSLDEDVNKGLVSWQVPENEFTQKQRVTLRGLLSHSAGISGHGFKGYYGDEPVPTLLQILEGKAPANSKPVRVEAVPKEGFRYSGGGYLIVQQLLVDVARKPFPILMRDMILKKLGMNHSTFQQPLPKDLWGSAAVGHTSTGEKMKGNWGTLPEMAPAGLWATPADLARFAIEIQRSKAGKSNRILSLKLVREMLTPQLGGWGLGLELEGDGGSARFGHSGSNFGYRCQLTAYADTGQGAVVMTNSDGGSSLAGEILRSIAREYEWPDYLSGEKAIASVDPKVYDDYIGQYQLEPDLVITIRRDGGRLMGQLTGREEVELFAESDTEFFLRTSDSQIRFVRDAQGKVTGLALREGRGGESLAPRIR